ncbi:hypothetical protein EYF80_048145 [Liparis tanakae]|uniref:Uncharacterized protein n=1 Tax=Liparis tanakae TaxID=230148 RepID=A0A4Z2FL07_9TELE|nr:hypothetical protein EYF80_048145 [Liparis tanakae]
MCGRRLLVPFPPESSAPCRLLAARFRDGSARAASDEPSAAPREHSSTSLTSPSTFRERMVGNSALTRSRTLFLKAESRHTRFRMNTPEQLPSDRVPTSLLQGADALEAVSQRDGQALVGPEAEPFLGHLHHDGVQLHHLHGHVGHKVPEELRQASSAEPHQEHRHRHAWEEKTEGGAHSRACFTDCTKTNV